MRSPASSKFNVLKSAATLVALVAALNQSGAADGRWVTTWATAPQLTEPGNLPPVPLAHSTLRQFVRVSIGGTQVRVRFSNAYGTDPVVINAARIALAPSTASGGNGDIITNSQTPLTFRGAPGAVVPRGQVVYSDPVDFVLPALTNVAISTFFGDISATTINGHPGSRTTSFIQAGDSLSAPSMPGASKTRHWYIITGLEILGSSSNRAVVVLGDSLTDGRGSTDDGNNRWPDKLAERLLAHEPTSGVGVVNMGIGGNAIFGGLGPSAVNRFDRDVLDQKGVRYLIVFEGVNDIGSGASSMTTATNLINAYTEFANKARSRNIRAYGATITPFGGSGYYSTLHEQERQFVNAWFRTNTVFDGVIDLDAAVRDPADPSKFKAEFYPGVNANDWLHLNTAGYKALADAIDLNLFTE
ncbi:MAG TPA: SGNH/GDSL hydrolase family protein [Verrucomicrobiae bacterium]|nr:SGNH/GDSL hydrolase family protein [Verrucomicrobiae bacterium]